MRRAADRPDLDVLADDPPTDDAPTDHPPNPPARPPQTRRRRWPWVAGAAVLLAGVIAFPVRARLAAAQLGRLDARWQAATELDRSRASLITQLRESATAADAGRLGATIDALDDELASRLHGLDRRIASELLVDPRMRHLAHLERRALSRAVTTLRAHAYGALDNGGVVARQLDVERRHFHRAPPRPGAHPAALVAANPSLSSFQQWLDEPTGSVLIVPFNHHLLVLDVDKSTVSPMDPPVDGDHVVTRGDSIVVLDEGSGHARAVQLDGSRPAAAVDLGPADSLLRAVEDSAVWIVRNRVDVPGSNQHRVVATKVDMQGHVLQTWEGTPLADDGPPTSEDPVAETSAGLVVVRGGAQLAPQLEIVPLDGAPTIPFSDVSFPFSAGAFGLAWVDLGNPEHALHVWSAASRTDHVVGAPPGFRAAFVGGVSPDGHHLIALYAPTGGDGLTQLAIVDMTSVVPTVQLEAPMPNAGIVAGTWTPDGQRVFLGTRDDRPLTTYRLGDRTVHQLRLHGFAIPDVAAVR